MTGNVEVKVSELSRHALDWATFCAVYPGMQPTIRVTGSETRFLFKSAAKPVTLPRTVRLTYTCAYGIECNWYPSSDWDCGGPLIEKYRLCTGWMGDEPVAFTRNHKYSDGVEVAPTLLIAACRAIVASVLGPVVSVPKELCQ